MSSGRVEVDGATGGRGILGRPGAPVVDDVGILVISHGNESPVGALRVPTGCLRDFPGLGIGVKVLMINAVGGIAPHGSVGEGSGGKAAKDGELSSESHGESKRECQRRLIVAPATMPTSVINSVIPASRSEDFG